MKKPTDTRQVVKLFEGIAAAFPQLAMKLESEHPHVDVNMDIPQQAGLAFEINLNLQGDELHLSAGGFWLEWFPCENPDVVAAFREAVHGLLSGTFRIVEHCRGSRVVKAELQQPQGEGWRTIGTYSTFFLPIPWRKHTRVLQNELAEHVRVRSKHDSR